MQNKSTEADEYCCHLLMEREKTRKALDFVNSQRKPSKVPYKREQLWQFGLLLVVGSLVGIGLVLWWMDWALDALFL